MTLFLCGDVMTGRGVDQILPHPCGPELREPYVEDARTYVELAEQAHGEIPKPVDFDWPWGDSLSLLEEAAPDARIVNLETSVTTSDDFAPRKRIHYRMHPDNVPCLAAAEPDCCVLANNHVLDLGEEGLHETLGALEDAGLATAGAGRDIDEARRPATVDLGDDRRLLVFGLGMTTSGVPAHWEATADRPGVAFAPEPTDEAAEQLLGRVGDARGPSDAVVVSVHWGSNWGYEVPAAQRRFAHRLVEGGVDVVHGHSSHHPRPVETHDGRLILHGCGDFINDYEGISGRQEYRDDLRLAYLVTLRPDGALRELRMVPFRSRRMRLEPPPGEDRRWLRDTLERVGAPVDGPPIGLDDRGHLVVEGA